MSALEPFYRGRPRFGGACLLGRPASAAGVIMDSSLGPLMSRSSAEENLWGSRSLSDSRISHSTVIPSRLRPSVFVNSKNSGAILAGNRMLV
jgi:hypothetical protein